MRLKILLLDVKMEHSAFVTGANYTSTADQILQHSDLV